MTACDEILSASWVIPVEGPVLQNGAVVVKDGVILAVLPSEEAKAKYSGVVVELPGRALMPGLVNAHTHLAMSLLRGVSDDQELIPWLTQTIWPLEGALADENFVKDGATLAAAECIRSGTTTVNDMYWFPHRTAEALCEIGLRALVNVMVIEFPSQYGSGPEDYIAKGLASREAMKDQPLLGWTVAPHAPYTVTDATFERVKQVSEEHGLPVHVHLHETSVECDASEKLDTTALACHKSEHKLRPFQNLNRIGLVNEKLIAVHMTCLTDEEIKVVAEKKVSIVHCPTSNLKLASGFCPVAKLVAQGVNVAIGTDGQSSNNTVDMMAEMKLAAILAKGASHDPKAVPAQEALRMATINGAKALHLADKIGSLEVGKQADIIAINLDTIETTPVPVVADSTKGFDPVTHVVYSSTRDQVTDVWVAGKRLLEARQLKTVDEARLKQIGADYTAKVMEVMAGNAK